MSERLLINIKHRSEGYDYATRLDGDPMNFKQFLNESFDRARANQAIASYDYQKKPPLDDAAKSELMKVVEVAKDKLVKLVNGDKEILDDWPKFKAWLKRNESKLMRMSYSTWIGSSVIVKPKGHRISVTKDDRLEVSPDMSSLIQWRFVILDAEKSLKELSKDNNESTITFKDRFKKLAAFV